MIRIRTSVKFSRSGLYQKGPSPTGFGSGSATLVGRYLRYLYSEVVCSATDLDFRRPLILDPFHIPSEIRIRNQSR